LSAAITDAWPFPPIAVDLDLRRSALLVVDMQYHNVHPEFGIGSALAAVGSGFGRYFFRRVKRLVIPNNARLLKAFREAGLRVVFVTLGSELPDLSDLSVTSRQRSQRRQQLTGQRTMFSRAEPAWQIIPELEPREGELVVNKTTLSAFNSSSLDKTLRNMGIGVLLVTGVVTDVCVEATARDAVDHGFATILVDDACAAWDARSHRSTMQFFSRFLGRVATTDEILSVISTGGDRHVHE
jgi:nicotinamidase-related amidase